MKFKLCYTDNPWQFNARNNAHTKFGTGMHKYIGMSEAELVDLYVNHVTSVLEENCAIVSWTVAPKLDQYFHIVDTLEPYGFRHVTKLFTWVKVDKQGNARKLPGHYTMSNTEDAYLLMRGSMPVVMKGISQVIQNEESLVIHSPILKPHSTKPVIVKDLLIKLFGDCSRLELFARSNVKYDGTWMYAGNEVQETLGMDIRTALDEIRRDVY